MEFVANTLVFILAGVVIAGRIYESSHDGSHLIQAQDWGYALLLWVYLTVSLWQLRASPCVVSTSWLTYGRSLSADIECSTGGQIDRIVLFLGVHFDRYEESDHAIPQVIRAAMLVAFWPLLNSWGYVITSREAVVLCWSGLRGAVGLSLALFILLDGNISDLRYRTLTFFHMGCVAFLTIIFQGTSMKPLLQVQCWRRRLFYAIAICHSPL